MKNSIVSLFITLSATSLLLTACKSPTVVDLASPTGSTLTLGGKVYPFPSVVSLKQRTKKPQETDGAYDISLMIDDPASPGGFVPATGKLYVYSVALTDVDRMARNHFSIPAEKIEALKSGAAVTIEGLSADGGKLLYRAIIGLRRTQTKP